MYLKNFILFFILFFNFCITISAQTDAPSNDKLTNEIKTKCEKELKEKCGQAEGKMQLVCLFDLDKAECSKDCNDSIDIWKQNRLDKTLDFIKACGFYFKKCEKTDLKGMPGIHAKSNCIDKLINEVDEECLKKFNIYKENVPSLNVHATKQHKK